MKKRINISLENYILDMLDELAKRIGIDRSAMIAVMTLDEFNRLQIDEKYGIDEL